MEATVNREALLSRSIDQGVVVVPSSIYPSTSNCRISEDSMYRQGKEGLEEPTDPGSADLCSSGEQQTRDVLRVSVEVDNHRLIGGEETLKGLFIQGMGMLTSLTQNEQVVDVDDSDSDTLVSQESSSGDSLESDFDTTTNKDDIGVEAFVSGESLPDGRSGDTVPLSLCEFSPNSRCHDVRHS